MDFEVSYAVIDISAILTRYLLVLRPQCSQCRKALDEPCTMVDDEGVYTKRTPDVAGLGCRTMGSGDRVGTSAGG